jgi:hypothetical protein
LEDISPIKLITTTVVPWIAQNVTGQGNSVGSRVMYQRKVDGSRCKCDVEDHRLKA